MQYFCNNISILNMCLRMSFRGIPWWSSGQESVLSLPRARVQSLVRELRFHKLRGAAEKKKKECHLVPFMTIHSFSPYILYCLGKM